MKVVLGWFTIILLETLALFFLIYISSILISGVKDRSCISIINEVPNVGADSTWGCE